MMSSRLWSAGPFQVETRISRQPEAPTPPLDGAGASRIPTDTREGAPVPHDLTIHETPVDSLALLPGNPRQGDIGAVTESMRINGIYQPVIVNRGTHTGRPLEVIAGNHRVQAARALGHATIPAIILDVDDDTATRIALADNRTSDLADYDTDALIVMLQSLDDLAGTGYDADDIDDLLATCKPEPEEPATGGGGLTECPNCGADLT